MSVIVNLALATICFTHNGTEECHPALIGKNHTTPVGEFNIRHVEVRQKGYGGDVLLFHENSKELYAIHRIWLMNPGQRRLERIQSKNPKDRIISAGCINVMPEVYEKLVDCCSDSTLTIK